MTRLLQSQFLSWSAALVWSLLLTIVLLQGEADPIIDLGIPRGENTLARELAFSALHLVAFAVTGWLWFYAFAARYSWRVSLVAGTAIAIALGCSTEALQSLRPDRYASWLDFAANITGALLAARIIWWRVK